MRFRVERRRDWRSLTAEEKQQRLEVLRRRQQRQVEREMLRLSPGRPDMPEVMRRTAALP